MQKSPNNYLGQKTNFDFILFIYLFSKLDLWSHIKGASNCRGYLRKKKLPGALYQRQMVKGEVKWSHYRPNRLRGWREDKEIWINDNEDVSSTCPLPLTPRKMSWYRLVISVRDWINPRINHSVAGRIRYPIENRTNELPGCSVTP